MKNKLFLTLGLLLSLGIFLPACHKDAAHEHNDEDVTPPAIVISSPVADAAISGLVAIIGKVSDESLHELRIKVTRDSDDKLLFSKSPTVHDLTEYDFDLSWTPVDITDETAVTLSVQVEDHSDHSVTQTLKFKVKP